jgi:hypothetical protein
MPLPSLAVRRLIAGAALAAATLSAAPAGAEETRVRARYNVTVAGFEIGTASMQAGVDGASYDMNISMRMTGLAKFFTAGRGAATARGAYQDGKVIPTAYAINTRSGEKGQIVRFALVAGAVRQMSVEPPSKAKNIVPVTEADKRGVVDPVSALMMPVPGDGDLLSPASCDRMLPVFDGRQRYNVTLRYDRMETATTDGSVKGAYDGKLIVCKASYAAISGHRPGREQVTFMENNKDMEVWLAPVPAARALLPWKIAVRTQVGKAIITATSFVIGGEAGDPAPAGADL